MTAAGLVPGPGKAKDQQRCRQVSIRGEGSHPLSPQFPEPMDPSVKQAEVDPPDRKGCQETLLLAACPPPEHPH